MNAQRLFKAAEESPIFEAAVVLAAVTGMRLGEIFALRWSDVTWARRQWSTSAAPCSESKDSFRYRRPRLPVSPRRRLIGHRARRASPSPAKQNTLRLAKGDAWEDNDLIFPNAWGRFMATDYFVRREFSRILGRAGLPRFASTTYPQAHLRHFMLDSQQPIKVVSEMLGHSRTAITQDLYTHVSAKMQRTAADALDEVLRSTAHEDRRSGVDGGRPDHSRAQRIHTAQVGTELARPSSRTLDLVSSRAPSRSAA